jgi:HK97 family phage major capsid protein
MKGQVAIPETAEELEELLNDDRRIGEIMAAGQLAEFNKAYMDKALALKAAALAPQMREQQQADWADFLRGQAEQGYRPKDGYRPGMGAGVKGREARCNRAIARSRLGQPVAQVEKQALFSDRTLGAAVDDTDYARSMSAFFHACYVAERSFKDKGDAEGVSSIQGFKRSLKNALSERIPAEGGFLVPEVLRSEILMIALETAVVRPRARIVPMDSLRVPLPAIDDTSHASNVYGGVTGYWTEEGAALTASAPSFANIVLEAKKLTAYTTIPNELLQDSITPLDTWFNSFFPKAIAWFEDVAFIGSATTGTGTGEPQGFLNAPAGIKVSTSSAGEIKWSHIANAYSRMWPASLNSAVWLCSPDTMASLLQMAMNDLTNTSTSVAPPLWLSQMQALDTPGGGNGDGVTYRLMGRPLIVSEKMPAVGGTAAGALTFVDLDYYLIGDRQTMQIASSDEYLFANDLVAYRVIERLDGRFWLQSAITPENGSANTLSPLVMINTDG